MHDLDRIKTLEFFQSRVYAEKITEPKNPDETNQENINNFLDALRPTSEELQSLFVQDSEQPET